MFKPMIAALIAATALVPPALAQDRGGRGGERGQRSESSGNNGGQDRGGWRQRSDDSGQSGQRSNYRGQGQQQQVQAQPQPQAAPQPQQQNQYRGDRGNQGGAQAQGQDGYRPGTGIARGEQYRGNGNQGQQGQGQQFRGDRGQGQQGQGYRGNDNRGGDNRGEWRGNNGNRGNDGYRGNNGNRGNDGYRGNNGYRGNDGYRGDNGNNSRWSRNWRSSGQYNWRDRRAHDNNRYRLPRYYAPRGYNYGYNRFSIGFTLGSLLFSQQYWLNDPFYYGLPPAYGTYRWVRYYNDALLVDIRTGMVVDVEYDIFW